MAFSNVDLPVAFWKALCGHWSQGSKGKRWPHPARVTVEVPFPSLSSAPSHLAPLHTLSSSSAGIHGVRALSLCGRAHLRGARRQTRPRDTSESGGVGSVLGSVLGGSGGSQGAGRAARSLFLCRPKARQMWGPGIPPGEGGWSSRSAGVVGPRS